MPQCQRCNSQTEDHIFTPVKKIWVCDDCMNHYRICSGCGFYFSENILHRQDGYWFCSHCVKKRDVICKGCGEEFLHIGTTLYNGEYYCDSCYDELTVDCAKCEEKVELGDILEKMGKNTVKIVSLSFSPSVIIVMMYLAMMI